jgi:hypothetical protein
MPLALLNPISPHFIFGHKKDLACAKSQMQTEAIVFLTRNQESGYTFGFVKKTPFLGRLYIH